MSSPVKAGDTVYLLMGEDEHEALVMEPLSSQFASRSKRKKQVRFYFYADKGVTWRPAK